MPLPIRIPRLFSLRLCLCLLLVALVLLTAGAVATIVYWRSANTVQRASDELLDRSAWGLNRHIDGLLAPTDMALNLLVHSRLVRADDEAARLDGLPLLRAALEQGRALDAVYIAYPNGDFFLLRRLPQAAAARARFKAPAASVYLMQSRLRSAAGTASAQYRFYDAAFVSLGTAEAAGFAAFDPLQRVWYQEARASAQRIITPPYRFYSSGEAGVTLAQRAGTGGVVVGADLSLGSQSRALVDLELSPSVQVALLTEDGSLIAYQGKGTPATGTVDGTAGLPRLAAVNTPVFKWLSGQNLPASGLLRSPLLESRLWQVRVRPVSVADRHYKLLLAEPEDELLAGARAARGDTLWLMFGLLLLAMPASWWCSRLITRPIHRLTTEAEKVRRLDFTTPIQVRSRIREVQELADNMALMKSTVQRLLIASTSLAEQTDFASLLEQLVDENIKALGASAGILFLHEGLDFGSGEGGRVLARTCSEEGRLRSFQWTGEVPPQADRAMQSRRCEGFTWMVGPLRISDGSLHPGGGLVVPLFDHQHEPLGFLLLLLPTAPDQPQLSFAGALSGMASVALETQGLIRAQQQLFESMIQLLAGAIDAKSPYTGGHCARVPALTKLLARAACDDTTPPFVDFTLDEQQWEAVHVASWLHDCGKITTPEYVVDKATKLETLYDRIHEIRTRFEVLKRDADIAYWRGVAEGGDAARLAAERDSLHATLDEEFTFVAACNQGGEFLSAEAKARLRRIGERRWWRTLDKRLGLGHEESARMPVEASSLPAEERLLDDRPEHRITRTDPGLYAPGNRWGFTMVVPPLLYDRGELHNLTVARGTLTEEERFKINEHILQTIIMLDRLPFPRHLRQVPELAGGHHERMDGRGYPRGLTGEEMSPVARMMAIADIFEALTAVDRPYKHGKTLSEALAIMARMRDEGHIDPDIFALFLRSGVYSEYARQFLQPGQIDAVAIDDYLPAAHSTQL